MEELAKLLQENLGMSKDRSVKAAAISLEFVKERLPSTVLPQLNEIIDADEAVVGELLESALGDLAGDFSGLQGVGGEGPDTE